MSVLSDFEEDFDDDLLWDESLTVSEAATIFHVTENQIRHWWHRGHLTPTTKDLRGRPRFRGLDVLRALAEAEANTRRTQVTNLATRRAVHRA